MRLRQNGDRRQQNDGKSDGACTRKEIQARSMGGDCTKDGIERSCLLQSA